MLRNGDVMLHEAWFGIVAPRKVRAADRLYAAVLAHSLFSYYPDGI